MRKVISSKGTYSGCTTLAAFDKILEKAFHSLPQIRVTKDYSWIYETDKQWIRVTTGKASSTSIILTIEVLSKGKFNQEANRALLSLIFKTINETCEKLDFPLTPSGRARSVKPLNTFVEEPVIYEEYTEENQDEEDSVKKNWTIIDILLKIGLAVFMGFLFYYFVRPRPIEYQMIWLFAFLGLYCIALLLNKFVNNQPKWLRVWLTNDPSDLIIMAVVLIAVLKFFPKEESDSNFSWPFAQEETSFPDKPIVTFDPVKGTETNTGTTYNDESEFESQQIEEEPIIEDTYDWIYKEDGWVGTIYGQALGFQFFDNGEVYAIDVSGDYMYRYSIDKDNNRIKVLLNTGETLFLDLEPRERAIYINGTRLH